MESDASEVRAMIAKINVAKRIIPQSGFERFVGVLRILSLRQHQNFFKQDAYNACAGQRSAQEVDKEWNKIKYDDAQSYDAQVQLLRKWFREDASIEDYEQFCKEYIFDDDLDWDASLKGFTGLADMFIRKCGTSLNRIRLVSLHNNDDDYHHGLPFTMYSWLPNEKLWSCEKYNNESRVFKCVTDTLDMMLSAMIFIAKDSSQVSKMIEQRNALASATSLCLKKNLIKVIGHMVEQEDDLTLKRSPYLIAIANGMCLNIRTLEVRERNQDDFFVSACPINYCGPPSEKFEELNALKYMYGLTGGEYSRELMDYMMQIFGSSILLGYPKKHAYLLTDYSDGRETNHFVRILKGIFGGCCSSSKLMWVEGAKELVCKVDKKASQRAFEAYQSSVTIGATRVCFIAEPFHDGHETIDTEKVARLLEWNNARGIALLMVANYNEQLPTADFDSNKSISQYVRLLTLYPQSRYANDDKEDRRPIDPDNKEDLSRIFTLLCRSLKPWFENGQELPLHVPERMSRDMNHWKEQNTSFVSKFVAEMCLKGSSSSIECNTKTFHDAFVTWFNRYHKGKKYPSPTSIKQQMHELGFKDDKNRRVYLGIDLLQISTVQKG